MRRGESRMRRGREDRRVGGGGRGGRRVRKREGGRDFYYSV